MFIIFMHDLGLEVILSVQKLSSELLFKKYCWQFFLLKNISLNFPQIKIKFEFLFKNVYAYFVNVLLGPSHEKDDRQLTCVKLSGQLMKE